MIWAEYLLWETETRQAIAAWAAALRVTAGHGVTINQGRITVRRRDAPFVIQEKAPWQATLFVSAIEQPPSTEGSASAEIPLDWKTGAARLPYGARVNPPRLVLGFAVKGGRGVNDYGYVFPVRVKIQQLQPQLDPDNTNYREEVVGELTLDLGRSQQTVEFSQIGPESFTQIVRIKNVERI